MGTEMSVKVAPLTRDGDYKSWASSMRALLISQQRLDKFLDRIPNAASSEEKESDVVCKAKLQLHVSGPLKAVVERASSSHQAWKALKEEYIGSLKVRQPMLMSSLTNLSQGNLTIIQYIDKARELRDEFEALSMQASLPLLNQRFIAGLCDDLQITCAAALHATLQDSSKDLDDIAAQLRSMVMLLPEKYASINATQAAKPAIPQTAIPHKDPRTCRYCKKKGHIEAHCRKKKRDEAAKKAQKGSAIVMAVGDECIISALCGMDKTSLWYDTGATHHVVFNEAMLCNRRPSSVNTVVLGGNERHNVSCEGDLHVTNDVGRVIIFTNVICAPTLQINLCSGCQFTNKGGESWQHNDHCHLMKDGVTLLKGRKVQNMYKLKCSLPLPTETASANATSALWHRRLGHPGAHVVSHLVTSKAVKGMEGTVMNDTDKECPVCTTSKQTRETFQRSASVASKPLELLHSDIAFMPCEALEGEKYVLTVLDDYSRYSEVVCLNRKSSATDELIAIINRLQRQTGHCVKRVRTDQGTEYFGFSKYCKQQGIVHELSAVYTPEQNGRAERLNRTLMERTRALLQDYNAPKVLWSEAVKVACMTRNCIPSEGKTCTPHELLFETKPNLQMFRVFGCAASVHTPKQKRDKLDPTSLHGVFVGYAKYSKAWRILISSGYGSCKIVESANVRFDEGSRGKFPPCIVTEDEQHDLSWLSVEDTVQEDTSTPQTTHLLLPQDTQVPPATTVPTIHTQGTNLGNPIPQDPPHDPAPNVPPPAAPSDNENAPPDIPPATQGGPLAIMPAIPEAPQMHPVAEQLPTQQNTNLMVTPAAVHVPDPPGAEEDLPLPHEPAQQEDVAMEDVADPCATDDYTADDHTEDEHLGMDLDEPNAYTAEEPRRSKRERNPSIHWYRMQQARLHTVQDLPDNPQTYKEAMARPDKELWEQAIAEELSSLQAKNVYSTVDTPEDVTPLPSKLVLTIKRDALGGIEKYKARLVAKGFKQIEGRDYDEVFAPTAQHVTLRVLLATASTLDLEVHQLDVRTAFLNGELSQNVYLKLPIELGGTVWLLHKALYGLKQAARAWHAKLREEMQKYGFIPSYTDPCFFYRGTASTRVYVLIHVDDALVVGKKKSLLEAKKTIASMFDIKDLGPASYFLGMLITKNADGGYSLSQPRYVKDILTSFRMEQCKPCPTPLELGAKLIKSDQNLLPDPTRYMALVGKLIYLAVNTRPDISHAVGILSRFMSCPTKTHWKAGMHVLQYLKGTPTLGLTYKGPLRTSNQGVKTVSCDMFSDANHAPLKDNRKSTTGALAIMQGAAVSWLSKLQQVVATSTAEAEYIAAGTATKQGLWLRKLLAEINGKVQPLKLHVDNQSAIVLATEHTAGTSDRTKHIDIQYHFIRDRYQRGDIAISFVPTSGQHADIFTKQVPGPEFRRHLNVIMGVRG